MKTLFSLSKAAVAHFLEANLSGEMDNYFELWHSGFIQRPDGFMTAMEKVVENSKKETEKLENVAINSRVLVLL